MLRRVRTGRSFSTTARTGSTMRRWSRCSPFPFRLTLCPPSVVTLIFLSLSFFSIFLSLSLTYSLTQLLSNLLTLFSLSLSFHSWAPQCHRHQSSQFFPHYLNRGCSRSWPRRQGYSTGRKSVSVVRNSMPRRGAPCCTLL